MALPFIEFPFMSVTILILHHNVDVEPEGPAQSKLFTTPTTVLSTGGPEEYL